ncbi:TPA: PTS sugar transporter subunit IIA, partial [Enterococcus faecium]
DGKPAHMIFMIAVPENSQGDMHLKILQRLSRKLMDDDFRQALMEAPDKTTVHQLLSEM